MSVWDNTRWCVIRLKSFLVANIFLRFFPMDLFWPKRGFFCLFFLCKRSIERKWIALLLPYYEAAVDDSRYPEWNGASLSIWWKFRTERFWKPFIKQGTEENAAIIPYGNPFMKRMKSIKNPNPGKSSFTHSTWSWLQEEKLTKGHF